MEWVLKSWNLENQAEQRSPSILSAFQRLSVSAFCSDLCPLPSLSFGPFAGSFLVIWSLIPQSCSPAFIHCFSVSAFQLFVCALPFVLASTSPLCKDWTVNAVKVDTARRIQLDILVPGDLYEPEIRSGDEITLHRIRPSQSPVKLTKAEARLAIEQSPLNFSGSWDRLREETRE